MNDQERRLRDLTGETIILAQRSGLDVQYIQVLSSTADIRLVARIGTLRRLVRATTGLPLLAGMNDRQIDLIRRRSNADAAPADQVGERALAQKIQRFRAHGWVCDESPYTPGASVLAVQVALGVGGPSERIADRQQYILDAPREVGAWTG